MFAMRFVHVVLVCLLWVLSCNVVWANNNLFLPGDAFFPTELTADDLGRLTAGPNNPPVFEYSTLGGYDLAFCGYAGYGRAKVPALDGAFVENLKQAYASIREGEDRQLVERKVNGTKTLVETNPVRILFYRQDFAFPKFKLGLRYNEDWVNEVLQFGYRRQDIRLCCLVEGAAAVEEEWRDATSVARLDASVPEVDKKPVPRTDESVTINGPVKAFVLNSRPLSDYFAPKKNTSVLVVDSSGITKLTYVEGEWTAETNGE